MKKTLSLKVNTSNDRRSKKSLCNNLIVYQQQRIIMLSILDGVDPMNIVNRVNNISISDLNEIKNTMFRDVRKYSKDSRVSDEIPITQLHEHSSWLRPLMVDMFHAEPLL